MSSTVTTSTPNQFEGNLQALGYAGPDGTAHAAADITSTLISGVYAGLATAAGETGALPGPIGVVGAGVGLALGIATAGSGCSTLGAVAGAVGGIAGAAAATPTGLAGQFIAGAAVAAAAQKALTAACQTANGYVNGNPPFDPAAVQSTLVQTGAQINTAVATAIPTVDADTAAFLQAEQQLFNQTLNLSIQALSSFGGTPTTASTTSTVPLQIGVPAPLIAPAL